jgi:hypothetical protein
MQALHDPSRPASTLRGFFLPLPAGRRALCQSDGRIRTGVLDESCPRASAAPNELKR